jgi:hypothetical protein
MYGMPIPFNFLRIAEWERLFRKVGLEVVEASVPSAMNVFFKVRAAREPCKPGCKKKGK